MDEVVRRVQEALKAIPDPEMPAVSIADLGMVRGVDYTPGGRVRVMLTPTFLGCPALGLIEQHVRDWVAQLPGVASVEVEWTLEPAWRTEDISEEGWARLRAAGIARPHPEGPACPYCGRRETVLENLFGPTSCRSLYYCKACRNPFELIKPL